MNEKEDTFQLIEKILEKFKTNGDLKETSLTACDVMIALTQQNAQQQVNIEKLVDVIKQKKWPGQKKSTSGAPKQTKLIPGDSTKLTAINAMTLADKEGISDAEAARLIIRSNIGLSPNKTEIKKAERNLAKRTNELRRDLL